MKLKLIQKELKLTYILIKQKNFYCAHNVLKHYPCKQLIISLFTKSAGV